MQWRNVKLIWQREVRDQLRDRRTLFTIAVLPLLLYPLLGTVSLKVGQFMREHPSRVLILGSQELPAEPALMSSENKHIRFAEPFATNDAAQLVEVTLAAPSDYGTTPADAVAYASDSITSGDFDAAIYFPPGFRQRLDEFLATIQKHAEGKPPEQLALQAPEPQVFYSAADDKSKIAQKRVNEVLDQWRKEIVRRILAANNVSPAVTEPFQVKGTNLAPKSELRAAIWSKILPFVAIIWALTGAFYPAIDLCAGEKERGTLETLLSSPAQRSEIVCGKLLTVMAFSYLTAVLNLASMGLTGIFVIRQLSALAPPGTETIMGPPPLWAAGWLMVALIPISALFSAIALAVAALARSSKEGQYYLMPILLISLPLMILPILPAAELDLGQSLIPLTGIMLLLRSLMEGRYAEAAQYAGPVIAVTALCCLLAVRWAIDQFNNESVLFRESERWGLGLWLKHLVRDREETPSVGEALMCGVLLLIFVFIANFVAPMPDSWPRFASLVFVLQVALIATPAVLMAIMLTRNPAKTLLLTVPNPLLLLTLPLAPLLAVLLHPAAMQVAEFIGVLYPLKESALKEMAPMEDLMKSAPLFYVLGMLALLPAVCEELAFRGFILSGLRHSGHKWTAILLSAALFGATHGLVQQSLATFVVGVFIGYVAVQTGTLYPGILFHFTYNSLSLTLSRVTADDIESTPGLSWIMRAGENGGFEYQLGWTLVASALGLGILVLFHFLPYQRTAEEKLQEALNHQPAQVG